MARLKKAQFAELLMKKVGLDSKRRAGEVVDAFLDLIVSALSRGDEVAFPGFGVFRVARRAARMGINPKTGERISIPASVRAKFRVGKMLKEAVK